MVVFPNAKINIGLDIIRKRSDGFHEINTVFYPIGLKDSLEFIEGKETSFKNYGIEIDCTDEDNLILKAFNLIKEKHAIPQLSIALMKNIPFGAGLGGGSADASFMITALNEYYNLGMSEDEMCNISLQIGSDCPFFIKNRPMFASGRGEIFKEISLSLQGKYLVLINPGIHVGTKEAYGGIVPAEPTVNLFDAIQKDITEWEHCISNKFEESVFALYPEIKTIKEKLYEKGALFASMSGSGSSVFGIFEKEIDTNSFSNYFVWSGYLD